MHPLVRDLYKRAIIVGRDYPHPRGLDFVRETWKKAIRDEKFSPKSEKEGTIESERQLRKSIAKGRYAIREMIGVIQLKKYRTMRRRYGHGSLDTSEEAKRILKSCQNIK